MACSSFGPDWAVLIVLGSEVDTTTGAAVTDTTGDALATFCMMTLDDGLVVTACDVKPPEF